MQTPSAEQRRSWGQAVSTYRSDLAADTAAQAYLRSRGLGPKEGATWRLGVVRRPLSGHEPYVGRLCIPYLTPAGVVGVRFRCIEHLSCEGHAKYLSEPGAEGRLFNVLDLRKPGDAIAVAEGEIDAMTLSLCGIPAVGVPGVESWQKHWNRCLEDFSRVLVFADGDKPGRKFAGFLAKEMRAVPIHLPDGDDVNSLYLKEGPDGLRRLIR